VESKTERCADRSMVHLDKNQRPNQKDGDIGIREPTPCMNENFIIIEKHLIDLQSLELD
jgi:hypothetical protein